MAAVAAENNVLLMEAFMYRYGKNFEELNKTLASGRLGKIVGMQGNHGYTLDWASPAREPTATATSSTPGTSATSAPGCASTATILRSYSFAAATRAILPMDLARN